MTTPLSLAVGRFKQLPQRAGAPRQGGIVRIPAWVENPEDPSKPFRPRGAIWVSLHSGRLHLDLAPNGTTATPALALDVLLEFARKETRLSAGRPGRIEVVGVELRDALDAALAGTGRPCWMHAEPTHTSRGICSTPINCPGSERRTSPWEARTKPRTRPRYCSTRTK